MTKPTPLFTIPFPNLSGDVIGRVVRGHTMGAIKDGWLIFHEPATQVPPVTDPDILYCVETAEHEVLIRFLKPGRRKGSFDLFSVTGNPMLDKTLKWATPVTVVIPHKVTEDQIELLQATL